MHIWKPAYMEKNHFAQIACFFWIFESIYTSGKGST